MGRKKVHVKRSGSDLAFDIISYLILGIVSLIAVYPLYFVLIASISSPEAVNAGKVMLYPIGTRFYIRQQEQRWIYVLHLLQPIRFLSKNCREEKSLQDFSFLPCFLMVV